MRTAALRSALPAIACLVALAACTGRPIATPAPSGPARAAKIIVHTAGPYEIGPAALAAAGIGWAGEALARAGLTHRGQPVSSWIVGPPDAPSLRFYAGPPTSTIAAAAAEDVYWLEPGASRATTIVGTVVSATAQSGIGTAISTTAQSGIAAAPSDGVLVEVREQHDVEYVPLRSGDPWVWAGLTAPVTASFGLTLSHVLPFSAELELRLWTNVESPSDRDHHWRLGVGGNLAAPGTERPQVVADEAWDGVGERVITATLRPGLLRDGVNAVSLIGPGNLDLVDKVYMESLVVRYRREAVPDQSGRLAWLGQGSSVALAGFQAPLTLLDISQPLRAWEVRREGSPPTHDTIRYRDEPDHAYLAVGADGWQAPARIERPNLAPDLREMTPPDYLAIGPAEILAPLAPLVQAHRQAGLAVETVDTAAIFDQFGHGLAEPEAIRAFLADLRRRAEGAAGSPEQTLTKRALPGQTPPGELPAKLARPRYVLLVGDASYDLRPAGGASANRVPTFLVDTVFGGQTASDELFAELDADDDLDADDGPVLAVGRVPARTTDEVKVWVAKTVAYQAQRPEPAAAPVLMTVADPSEATFGADASAFGDRVRSAPCAACAPLDVVPLAPAGGGGPNLHNAATGPGDATGPNETTGTGAAAELNAERVAAELGRGPAVVAYFGHGSITQWGKQGLLRADALPDLRAASSSRLPVYLNFTCLTGLFTHPRVTSLAEALLFAPEGGAVAVLAPSSLTLPFDQHALTDALASTLASGTPLGEQLLAAWRAVPVDRPESRDVRRTFLLFGDPALVVMPAFSPASSRSPSPGEG